MGSFQFSVFSGQFSVFGGQWSVVSGQASRRRESADVRFAGAASNVCQSCVFGVTCPLTPDPSPRWGRGEDFVFFVL
jgi:hypothetical protein